MHKQHNYIFPALKHFIGIKYKQDNVSMFFNELYNLTRIKPFSNNKYYSLNNISYNTIK